MFFDTHAHLDDQRFFSDREEIINLVKEEGIGLVVNIGSNMESSKSSVELAKKHDFIYAAVGVHPHDSKELSEGKLLELKQLAAYEKVVAIGEIGLDYYYDNSPRDIQRYWFEKQLLLSLEMNKPVVIHCRDAYGDCMEILQKYDLTKNSGVMHCYSGSKELAAEIIKMGLYISIAGPVTYKNNIKTGEVVKILPRDKILIETDCPYLAPVPKRGERNYPGNVRYVAGKIAEILNVSTEEIAKQTMENGKNLFAI